MIDIHTHILPSVDDGAKDISESLRMCEIAADNGVNTIVATPHIYDYDKVKDLLQIRNEKISELNRLLKENRCLVTIYPGLEVYSNEKLFDIKDFSLYTINNSRYMLCEFDFNEFDTLLIARYIDHIVSSGVVPIISHPERCAAFFADYESLNDLMRWGVLFQINANSLSGYHGQKEQRLAITMLQCGFCDFLASDAHSPNFRSTDLLEIILKSQFEFSGGELQTLLVDNPEKVLNNIEIKNIKRGHISYDILT